MVRPPRMRIDCTACFVLLPNPSIPLVVLCILHQLFMCQCESFHQSEVMGTSYLLRTLRF